MNNLPPFSPSRLTFTDVPDAPWTFGQTVQDNEEGKLWCEGYQQGWKIVDTATEDPMQLYKLMISGIVPRPIAFVSSISEDGIGNLAPFSWFNMVTHKPPVISVSCSHTASGYKDTVNNIKATKGFTVNIISEPWIHNANATSIDAPPAVSEWSLSGLTKAETVHVKAPRVKESAFSMECELYQAIDIVHPDTGKSTTTLILGLVKYVHVRNDMLTENGTVDPTRLNPVARLGDISFATLGTAYRLPRPSWKDAADMIQQALGGRDPAVTTGGMTHTHL